MRLTYFYPRDYNGGRVLHTEFETDLSIKELTQLFNDAIKGKNILKALSTIDKTEYEIDFRAITWFGLEE